MMISYEDYLMGREKKYRHEITQDMEENAGMLLARVNLLISWAAADGVFPGIDSKTGTHVASGWRPTEINARTSNAGKASKHITMQGIDVQDTPDRTLARWCLRNLASLEEIGLWMEDPQWTGGADPWVHFQSVPPGSGRRVYVPSSAPPLAEKLPEQESMT